MATDLFLRRLERPFPETVIRAWADDMAFVFSDNRGKLGSLQLFFLELQRVAGLRLNIQKTVVVPFWQARDNEIRDILISQAPGWGGIKIADAMKYLGVMMGPGRGKAPGQPPFKST